MKTFALILSYAALLAGCGSSDSRTQNLTPQWSEEKNESHAAAG